MRPVLRNPTVLAVSLGHMAVDVLNSAFPILLAAFAVKLSLSNLAVGTVATAYTLAASLTQPLFGVVADRWEGRWVGVAGLIWLAGGFAIAGHLVGNGPFIALVIASLGSGAYHPQGALRVRRASGAQVASGTSLFFFFGQSGLALGPALAGLLLARFSLGQTMVALAAVTLPAVLMLLVTPSPPVQQAPQMFQQQQGERHKIAWAPVTVAAFILVLVFRGWPPAATNTFLPKWLADAGFSPEAFGTLLAVFMFSSAIGTVFGGWLADRWSRKGVVVLALSLMPLPFFLLYQSPTVGTTVVVAAAAAGFLSGMPHSIMVLMAQNLLPGRMGLASGLVLGFMFSVGAAASWITGWLADQVSLHNALRLIPWIAASGAFVSLFLPRTRSPQSRGAVTAEAESAL